MNPPTPDNHSYPISQGFGLTLSDGLFRSFDGILDGKQHNTLDAEWYGKIHCLSSLYLAALRAGETMATLVGDTEFQSLCKTTYDEGKVNIEELFNGEYYEQIEDLAHKNAIGVGKGCCAELQIQIDNI